MTQRPPSFTPVPVPQIVAVDAGLAAIAFLALSERSHARAKSLLPIPAHRTFRRLATGLALLHVVEAGIAWKRAREVGRGRKTAAKWAGQTLVVGFPSLITQQKTLLV